MPLGLEEKCEDAERHTLSNNIYAEKSDFSVCQYCVRGLPFTGYISMLTGLITGVATESITIGALTTAAYGIYSSFVFVAGAYIAHNNCTRKRN